MKACWGVIALAACCAAWAGESSWVHIGDSDRGSLLVNPGTIARRGEHIQAWFMWDSIKDRTVDATSPEKQYRSLKQLSMFDCNLRQTAAIQGVFYAGNNAEGQTVDTVAIDAKRAEFRDVPPDSVAKIILNYVCSRDPRG